MSGRGAGQRQWEIHMEGGLNQTMLTTGASFLDRWIEAIRH